MATSGRVKCFCKEKEIKGFMTVSGFSVEVFSSPTAGVEEMWFAGKKT
jgi:hypothetical protein